MTRRRKWSEDPGWITLWVRNAPPAFCPPSQAVIACDTQGRGSGNDRRHPAAATPFATIRFGRTVAMETVLFDWRPAFGEVSVI